ncbi:MAG: alpha-amylase family glycosyl hydrolase [Candidatus Saccharimonas sp.]
MSHQVKKHLGVTLRKHEAEFRVWAPFAKSVAIGGTFTPDGRIELVSENDGYWSIAIQGVEPGQQYAYYITTSDDQVLERNDPRARAITSSDNGFSVIVDNEFDWGESAYIPPEKPHQIIYELHVGTFNRPDASTPGTFDTAIEKLDYLRDLGVTTIELMPITSMAYSNGWGYAPNYIYSVESMLGGRHGLMKFVRSCHERGMGVILDVVYNHFYGSSDLWQFDGWNESNRGGIYFYNDERGDTPWGGRPDYGRAEVRQFILDNITMWLTEYRLDGLRVDSTIYMRNTSGLDNDPDHDLPDAWPLLQDIVTVAHKINPHALVIAEDCASNAYITKRRSDGGSGFNAQWELGFPHVLRDALSLTPNATPSLTGIRYELEHSYNGDAFEKIIFSDSHDTAANGSVRINDAAAPRDPTSLIARQKTLLADTITLTAPGIPMLLQGAEFLQDGAFNDWQALQWEHTQTYSGFVEAHRHLIDLRLNAHSNTAGLLGQYTSILHQDDINLVIAYHRWEIGGGVDDTIVIANFSDQHFPHYELSLPLVGTWRVRFNSSWRGYSPDFPEVSIDSTTTDNERRATVSLAPFMAIVLSLE